MPSTRQRRKANAGRWVDAAKEVMGQPGVQSDLATLSRSQQRVYFACLGVCAEGYFPAPSILCDRLHGKKDHMLNGRECQARHMFFKHFGFKRVEPFGRWYLPSKPLWRRHGKGPVLVAGPETVDAHP